MRRECCCLLMCSAEDLEHAKDVLGSRSKMFTEKIKRFLKDYFPENSCLYLQPLLSHSRASCQMKQVFLSKTALINNKSVFHKLHNSSCWENKQAEKCSRTAAVQLAWPKSILWMGRNFQALLNLNLKARKIFCIQLKDVFTWGNSSHKLIRRMGNPYPAEGLLLLDFLGSNEFQPWDVVLQPPLIQSFEPWNLLLFHSHNQLWERDKRYSSEQTQPGQVWHQAQAVVNEWTINPGVKNGWCH